MQYVGETENVLHIRLNSHRRDIKRKVFDKPVPAHFCSINHSVTYILRYLRTWGATVTSYIRRESFWIYQLSKQHLDGLNPDQWTLPFSRSAFISVIPHFISLHPTAFVLYCSTAFNPFLTVAILHSLYNPCCHFCIITHLTKAEKPKRCVFVPSVCMPRDSYRFEAATRDLSE